MISQNSVTLSTVPVMIVAGGGTGLDVEAADVDVAGGC